MPSTQEQTTEAGWKEACLRSECFHSTASGSRPAEEQRLFLPILCAEGALRPCPAEPPAAQATGWGCPRRDLTQPEAMAPVLRLRWVFQGTEAAAWSFCKKAGLEMMCSVFKSWLKTPVSLVPSLCAAPSRAAPAGA